MTPIGGRIRGSARRRRGARPDGGCVVRVGQRADLVGVGVGVQVGSTAGPVAVGLASGVVVVRQTVGSSEGEPVTVGFRDVVVLDVGLVELLDGFFGADDVV